MFLSIAIIFLSLFALATSILFFIFQSSLLEILTQATSQQFTIISIVFFILAVIGIILALFPISLAIYIWLALLLITSISISIFFYRHL